MDHKMKVLLLGVGRWGWNHLRVLSSLPAELFVVDTDENKLKQCVGMGIASSHVSTDFHRFMSKINAAVIVTPAHTHMALGATFLKAGKDVFIEKPIALSSQEAAALTELANAQQCILQVGHIFRYDVASQWLYDAIRDGRFGRILMMRGSFQGFKRPRKDSGVAFADAVHFIDLFNFWMGSCPTSVTAITKDFMARGMEDEIFVSMDYDIKGGQTWATVEAGYHMPGKSRKVEVIGTSLSAQCDFNASPRLITLLENRHKKIGEDINAIEGPIHHIKLTLEEPLAVELKAFLSSVQTREKPLVGGKEACESLWVLEAAMKSARTSRSVAVNRQISIAAKDGGIALSQCFINDEIRQATMRVIDSGRYILDKECESFEQELALYTGVKHAVLCNSATMGILMLHQAMGVKAGDEIIVPSLTAFPTIEGMVHLGAKPVFIDIDDSYCLDVGKIEAAVTSRTVGILPVHLYGHPADLDPILSIAQKFHLWVIEDCAQAQGAMYKGKRVGSLGHAGVFSFFPSKNLTVLGDGGCVCTNDDALADKIRILRNHGRKEKYRHEIAGYNLRFNEMQAAIGRVGLRYLDQFNENRRAMALRYHERLKGIVRTPSERAWVSAVYHMYVIQTAERDRLIEFLSGHGINTGIHYPLAVHQQPAMKDRWKERGALTMTEDAVQNILSLPIHGEISLENVDFVCDRIMEYYQKHDKR